MWRQKGLPLLKKEIIQLNDVCGVVSPEGICVGPSQLEGLSHDEATEYLVKSVSVLRLTNDQILQFGVLRESVFSRV